MAKTLTDYELSRLESADHYFCTLSADGLTDDEALQCVSSFYSADIVEALKAKYCNDSNNLEVKPDNGPDMSQLEVLLNLGATLYPMSQTENVSYQIKDNMELIGGYWRYPGMDKEQAKKEGKPIEITWIESAKMWIDQGITRFLFRPSQLGFLCLDIDRNHGKGDGLANFYGVLKREGLEHPYFSDIEGGSFPCYVTTPRGGFHLYFKAPVSLLKCEKPLAYEVDTMGGNKLLTAPGSVKNNRFYSLHGNIKEAPSMPWPLVKYLSKGLEQEAQKTTYKQPYFKDNLKKGYTLQQCLEYGLKDAISGNNHDLIFAMACRAKRGGYGEQETLEAILNSSIHSQRRDKKDTVSCVQSVFRG